MAAEPRSGARTDPPTFAEPVGRLRRMRNGTLRGEVTNPAAVVTVLVEKAREFRKGPAIRFLRPVLGDGIFTSEGERWRANRRLIQPAFTRQNIDAYSEVMVRFTRESLDRWLAVDHIDTLSETRRLTLNIAVEALFGAQLSEKEARDLGAGVNVASEWFQQRVSGRRQLLLASLPTLRWIRIQLGIRQLHRVVDRIVDERRRQPGERHDLLSLLEKQTDPEVGAMTYRQLRHEVNTLLLSGHETTALGLAWSMWELARHPAAQAELAREVASVIGPTRLPQAEDLARLPFTTGVVKETLRLYPPLYVIGREPLHDVEVQGVSLKKGSRLRFNTYHNHRDERLFEDPHEFRPERWSEGYEQSLPRGGYMPFGLGPRICVGMGFALMELVLALATIRQRARIELAGTQEALPVPRISLQPDRPILLRLVAEPLS